MRENPYQPPAAPLTETDSPADRPRRRFRFRVIPATLCFVYGGSMSFAFVAQVGLIAWLAARVGLARINLGLVLLILAELSSLGALLLSAGWLCLRGKWLWAVTSIALAFGVGFGLDRTIGAGWQRDMSTKFLHRIVKPN